MLSRHFWLWPNLSSFVPNSSGLIITAKLPTALGWWMTLTKRQQPGWVIPSIFGLLILVISSAQCGRFHLEVGPWLSPRSAEQLEPGSWRVEHHGPTVPGWAGEQDSLWGVSDGGGCSVCWCWCQKAQGGTYLGEHPSWLPATHPHHSYRKLSHALALPLPLLQGQGKPTTLPGHKHAYRQVWEEAQPGSASSRPATQLAVSCHPLLAPSAFCLLKAAVHFYGNEHAELCWDSCCNTENTWKWEGRQQLHERKWPLAPGWKLKQDMAAAAGEHGVTSGTGLSSCSWFEHYLWLSVICLPARVWKMEIPASWIRMGMGYLSITWPSEVESPSTRKIPGEFLNSAAVSLLGSSNAVGLFKPPEGKSGGEEAALWWVRCDSIIPGPITS